MDGTIGDHGPLPMDLFDFDLPPELIAQEPLENRSGSRMLVLDRESGEIEHRRFHDIEQFLKAGDLLVINDTRVIRARLLAKRQSGGAVEFLLLEPVSSERWRALVRPSRRIRSGEQLTLLDTQDNSTSSIVMLIEKSDDGSVIIEVPDFAEREKVIGRVPLPHYISRPLDDPDRYQTVYADVPGSVAAPTAGLHFTQPLLDRLREKGIVIANITLHVGQGTFQPVKVEDARLHHMHEERFQVGQRAVRQIRAAKNEGRRLIAVGTTSCRTVETISDRIDTDGPIVGGTSLYITPGYRFQLVNGLLTNFHLPRSTLLLLVSAFASRESVLRSYSQAIEQRYRFYSFGDAMLIL